MTMQFSISSEDQKSLLQYARDVIRANLFFTPRPMAPKLATSVRSGAFVTLKEGGELRGCIGRMRSDMPLCETIAEMAWAAASEDPRFSPLRRDELPLVKIEITILSPLKPISPGEIEIGRHGLLISAQGRSGVLLPQVPLEFGWDRETFLEQLCRKAGLAPGSWKSPSASLFGFEGFVFSDAD